MALVERCVFFVVVRNVFRVVLVVRCDLLELFLNRDLVLFNLCDFRLLVREAVL